MSLKEELLTTAFEVYKTEADVSWTLTNNYLGNTQQSTWEALDRTIGLQQAELARIQGRVEGINGATIWNLGQDIALRVERNDDDAYYEDDSFREDFLKPLQNYLELHDHRLCFQALINRVYRDAQRCNAAFDRGLLVIDPQTREPIKVTDRRIRISVHR